MPATFRVVWLLVVAGLKLVVISGALRLAFAVVASRPLGAPLFEVDALDALTFVAVPPPGSAVRRCLKAACLRVEGN